MELQIFQADAFTDRLFGGNPAAVVPLEEWLPEQTMQLIARENNLSETAFFVHNGDHYDLRWFTPVTEVDLCGHATLATAHILIREMGHSSGSIQFESRSGRLSVVKEGDWYVLDFPTDHIDPLATPLPEFEAIGAEPVLTFKGREDYLLIYENQSDIESITPDFQMLSRLKSRGVIVSAPGEEVDFVSRCFFPAFGIDEDPVTGSAHTTLAPFWAERLGKNELVARQLSQRGGYLKIRFRGERTAIIGQAVTYLTGKIVI